MEDQRLGRREVVGEEDGKVGKPSDKMTGLGKQGAWPAEGHIHVIPALSRLRQETYFEASLGYKASSK